MDLAQKSSGYKPILTQGDQLNRIKVIRKRNKSSKGGVANEPNANSISPNFANSYPKLSSGNGRGSALDFRDIYNIHDSPTEDDFSVTESSETETYNRFCYETENPSPMIYRVSPSPKGDPDSPINGKDRNGQELNNGDSIESSLSTSATLTGRDSLSSSYPRTLTPINLPRIGLGSRVPSDNNIRAPRARAMNARGYDDSRKMDIINGSGNSAVANLSRPNMNPAIIPVHSNRPTQQNNWMQSATRLTPQKVAVTRDSPCALRASYPDGSDSTTSSSLTSTTVLSPPNRKRVDFASHSPLLPSLNSNSLPVNKTRETFHQPSYQLPSNGNGSVNGARNRSGKSGNDANVLQDNGFYLRTHQNYRNGEYPFLKYSSNNVTNGRTNGNRALSPSPFLSSNQITRHHIRSSSLKSHAPPIANSPVVYADIQTDPSPQFDYRPRANYIGDYVRKSKHNTPFLRHSSFGPPQRRIAEVLCSIATNGGK
ncbi:unnamed protein product [Rodentolepis nana]|uniref:WH2 domain-containing protein n=1 Tax=Rodentolepis nana TaxID=102285 RepID=A0A158QGK7_RODNA|nr:unnamed protein product [Rodentolepis nana]